MLYDFIHLIYSERSNPVRGLLNFISLSLYLTPSSISLALIGISLLIFERSLDGLSHFNLFIQRMALSCPFGLTSLKLDSDTDFIVNNE